MNEHHHALRESFRQALSQDGAVPVADVHAELDRQDLRPAELSALIERMRGHDDLGARINLWWHDPKTKQFSQILTC